MINAYFVYDLTFHFDIFHFYQQKCLLILLYYIFQKYYTSLQLAIKWIILHIAYVIFLCCMVIWISNLLLVWTLLLLISINLKQIFIWRKRPFFFDHIYRDFLLFVSTWFYFYLFIWIWIVKMSICMWMSVMCSFSRNLINSNRRS
jgi:hypothetical protein